MAGEVVHDDDVSGPQFRDHHLLHIGLEGVAVDRPVDDPWRDEASEGERTDEGGGLPVPVRDADLEPLARSSTAP
jgi:hypothetical protein